MARESRQDLSTITLDKDPLAKLDTLTDGSIRIPAIIARTGVQVYSYDDGTEVREYRPPDEVFNPESMETWRALSLTMGHPDNPVDPSNWGALTIGHVSDSVRANGAHLCTDAIVKDAKAIEAIAKGELVEVSCGYYADIDKSPGVTPDGEPYDQIQRGIVGNHVALGPKGWGRAGPQVRLLVGDSGALERTRAAVAYHKGMAIAAKPQSNKRRKDAEDPKPPVDPEDKDKTAEDADPPVDPEDKDKPAEDADPPTAEEHAKVCAERDALQAQVDALMEQSDVKAKTEDSRVSKRVALRVQALKADSAVKLVDAKGAMLSDSEIMLAIIRGKDPKFDSKGRDAAYIRARFDIACEGLHTAPKANANAFAAVVAGQRADGNGTPAEGNLAVSARERMLERNRNMAGPKASNK